MRWMLFVFLLVVSVGLVVGDDGLLEWGDLNPEVNYRLVVSDDDGSPRFIPEGSVVPEGYIDGDMTATGAEFETGAPAAAGSPAPAAGLLERGDLDSEVNYRLIVSDDDGSVHFIPEDSEVPGGYVDGEMTATGAEFEGWMTSVDNGDSGRPLAEPTRPSEVEAPAADSAPYYVQMPGQSNLFHGPDGGIYVRDGEDRYIPVQPGNVELPDTSSHTGPTSIQIAGLESQRFDASEYWEAIEGRYTVDGGRYVAAEDFRELSTGISRGSDIAEAQARITELHGKGVITEAEATALTAKITEGEGSASSINEVNRELSQKAERLKRALRHAEDDVDPFRSTRITGQDWIGLGSYFISALQSPTGRFGSLLYSSERMREIHEKADREFRDLFFYSFTSEGMTNTYCSVKFPTTGGGSAFAVDNSGRAREVVVLNGQRTTLYLYNETLNEIQTRYLYKLNVKVTNAHPDDRSVRFNVGLETETGTEVMLYLSEVSRDSGQTFSRTGANMHVFTSHRNYTKACLRFTPYLYYGAPSHFGNGLFRSVSDDLDGEMRRFCVPIREIGSATPYVAPDYASGPSDGSPTTTPAGVPEGQLSPNI